MNRFLTVMKKKWVIGIVGVLVVGGLVASAFNSAPKDMVYETATMSGTTVRTVVSVVGSVKAEKETNLAFAKNGTVLSVSAKEGQKISSGQILAELKREDVQAEVERTRAALAIEVSTLQKLRNGAAPADKALLETNIRNAQLALDALKNTVSATRDRTQKEVEEARIAYDNARKVYDASRTTTGDVNEADLRALEAAVASARASLEATRASNIQSIQSAQTSLDNARKELAANQPIANKNVEDAQERAFFDASTYMDEVDRSLRAMNDILTVEDYNKDQNLSYKAMLGVRLTNSYTNTLNAYGALRTTYNAQKGIFQITSDALSYAEILRRLDILRGALNETYTALTTTYTMLENSLTSVDLSQTKLDGFRNGILTQRAAVSAAISALATIRQNVENLELQKTSADTTYQNRVTAAEAALSSATAQANAAETQAKAALSTAEENQRKTVAGIGATGVDLQRLQNAVDEASKRLASAEARFQEQIASSNKNISDLEAQLRSAEAQKLAQGGPARPEDIAIQQSRVTQAQTALSVAEDNLEDAYIRSPKAGIISKVSIKEGEQAAPSGAAISLISENFDLIEANIAENEIARVKPGQKVHLTFDAFDPDTVYTGTVTFIDPAQTALDGVIYYRTEISFDPKQYPDLSVRPGFSANLDIVTEEIFTEAVPVQAVKDGGAKGKKVDILIEEGEKRTEERFIEIGLVGDDYIEVKKGLTPNDKVVISVTDPSKE